MWIGLWTTRKAGKKRRITMKAKDGQQKRILKYLSNHKFITRLDAYDNLGITELPKRISELRRLGYPIEDEWMEVLDRYGEKKRVKAYSLEEEEGEE